VKKRFTLLIGAPGSDTTRLFRHLGAHPQVLPSRVAEPRFFTDDRKWALGVEFYRSLWDFREPDERVAIEASSDYARHPQVRCPAERIAQLPTGFRFVYLLRDPLERIEAHHARDVEDGRRRGSLEQGVADDLVDASRYAAQLEAYASHFPPEDFLLVSHEELMCRPVPLLRRVCSFMEIDPYFGFPGIEGGESVQAPPAARRGLLDRLRGAASPAPRRPRREPPRLSPQQRREVLDALRDDLSRLKTDWGFDPSPWQGR
jgi:hypothetical protein